MGGGEVGKTKPRCRRQLQAVVVRWVDRWRDARLLPRVRFAADGGKWCPRASRHWLPDSKPMHCPANRCPIARPTPTRRRCDWTASRYTHRPAAAAASLTASPLSIKCSRRCETARVPPWQTRAGAHGRCRRRRRALLHCFFRLHLSITTPPSVLTLGRASSDFGPNRLQLLGLQR